MADSKSKSKLKKITGITVSLLSAVILVFVIIVLVSIITSRLNNKAPSILGYSVNLVASGSMEPAIKKGDLVISKKVSLDEIKEGDDIVFLSDDPAWKDLRIVHRVYSVKEDGSFVTYHINEISGTVNVPGVYLDGAAAARIEGKAVYVSSGLGKFLSLVTNGQNWIFALMLLILGTVIIVQIVNIIKAVKGKKPAADGAAIFDDMKRQVLDELKKEYGEDAVERLSASSPLLKDDKDAQESSDKDI